MLANVLVALAHRRSAIITAVITVAAVLYPTLSGPAGLSGVGITLLLGAVGAGVVGYVTAYAAIGRVEKALAGAVVVALSSLGAGLTEGLGVAALVVSVGLAVAAELGLVPALPSTEGSAARHRVTAEADEQLARQAARVVALQSLAGDSPGAGSGTGQHLRFDTGASGT